VLGGVLGEKVVCSPALNGTSIIWVVITPPPFWLTTTFTLATTKRLPSMTVTTVVPSRKTSTVNSVPRTTADPEGVVIS